MSSKSAPENNNKNNRPRAAKRSQNTPMRLRALIRPSPRRFARCGNPATVPAASVSAVSNAKSDEKAAPDSAGRTFAFGPDSATIDFIGSKVTGSHPGGFKNFAGEFRVVNDRLADTGNKVVIDMTSLWTDNNRVTGHLKNADFFDVPQFPTATFVSESITAAQSGSTVTGNLTLHGVTKKISFPASIQIAQDGVNVTAEFFINRFDFDQYPERRMTWSKRVVLKLGVKPLWERRTSPPGKTAQAPPRSRPRRVLSGSNACGRIDLSKQANGTRAKTPLRRKTFRLRCGR